MTEQEEMRYELIQVLLPNLTEESDLMLMILTRIFLMLPEEDRDILLNERDIRIIFVDANHATPFVRRIPGEADDSATMWFIMFQSDLLKSPEAQAIYTIVHELAHCYLDHRTTNDREQWKANEIAADEQVIKWGFESSLMDTPHNYLYGDGFKNHGVN